MVRLLAAVWHLIRTLLVVVGHVLAAAGRLVALVGGALVKLGSRNDRRGVATNGASYRTARRARRRRSRARRASRSHIR